MPVVGHYVLLWSTNPDRSKWERVLVIAVAFCSSDMEFYALAQWPDGTLRSVSLDGAEVVQ